MGNNESTVKLIPFKKSYNSVEDHLGDVVNELVKLDRKNEGKFFIDTVNALNSILYTILTTEEPYSGHNIVLDKRPNYFNHLEVVKRWAHSRSLLQSCYISQGNGTTIVYNDDFCPLLRSLITIQKYCSQQNISIQVFDISTMDPSSIFRNQVDEFLMTNGKFAKQTDHTNLVQPHSISASMPISYKSTSPNSSPYWKQSDNPPPKPGSFIHSAQTTKLGSTFTRNQNPNRTLGSRRLESERKQLISSQNEGIRLIQELGKVWIIEIDGAKNTLYENETYTLRFTFDDNYPIESPEVIFIHSPPVHPHIYSNGSICLSILYDAWSPALGVVPICLSLISMLSSCKKKIRPPDDKALSSMKFVKPKQLRWAYDDEKV